MTERLKKEVKRMSENKKMIITKEQEEKRLKDFQRIAENWDKLPERAQGKIDGIISMAACVFLDSMEKKAG